MPFIEQSFTITETNSLSGEVTQREVTGTVASDSGLGYYFDGEHYAPTHLASGYGLGPYFFYEQDVQEWIGAITPLTDWKKPAAIFFEPAYEKEIVPLMQRALVRITADYVTLIAQDREKLLEKARTYATQK